ncbi:cystatin-B-like [Heptranchias perlo]|uniref:cystatin-B-like n=1 Tax=Heptranchias perlo TaxID=212740 RepID=UPI00355A21CD
MNQQKMYCGGISDVKSPTPELQQIADSMKSKIEEHTNKTFVVFVVKAFKTQLVSGTNYFIKIHIGGDDYLHAKVFEDLPCRGAQRQLSDVKANKAQHDELTYF